MLFGLIMVHGKQLQSTPSEISNGLILLILNCLIEDEKRFEYLSNEKKQQNLLLKKRDLDIVVIMESHDEMHGDLYGSFQKYACNIVQMEK